ncbi:MAG: Rieske 2Fe-2S domain-containing protein [Actinomycetota bacterium]
MNTSWFPVADDHDIIPRHVVRASLHGHELVVWRADDGNVNVWENRCLHRGVRLSIGSNDGAELVCRYHAWRYANRSGGCTYIPAHPADAPARTVQCATHPVALRYGLVWTRLDGGDHDDPPVLDALESDPFVLRARPVAASAAAVLAALESFTFAPVGAPPDREPTVECESVPGGVTVTATVDDVVERVVVFVQPVGLGRSVVRPVRSGRPADPMVAWRHHARVLGRFVDEVERLPPTDADADGVVEVAVAPPVARPSSDRRTVRIERKWTTADQIAAFELVDPSGEVLPVIQPGDHIDVHLPGGLVRQYSLTNAPGESDRYRIGVKRTVDSAGGSAYLHEVAAVGDTLEISVPRNHFALRRNVPDTLLIAGGIGVTPILSMAQALARVGLGFELHYFASSPAEFAFEEILEALGPSVNRHVGLDADATSAELERLLAQPGPTRQVAACGPPPMLDRLRRLAADAGWADDAVQFEYFDSGEVDRSSVFTVELARSARTIEVATGVSVLDAIRADGIELASSCERGACGTCAVTVLDGEVEHNDVYLSPAERAADDTLLTCVSRATSGRLVLDL